MTEVFGPCRFGDPLELPRHGPRAGQGVVDGRDLVVDQVGIGGVDRDALLDDSLIIIVHRDAGRLEDARPFEVAGLDFQRVVFAVALGIEPLADRVAPGGWRDLCRVRGPVRLDSPELVSVEMPQVCRLRSELCYTTL